MARCAQLRQIAYRSPSQFHSFFFRFFFLARCQLQCLGAPIFSGFGDNTITFSHFLCQIRTGRGKHYIGYKNSPNTRHLVTTEVFKLPKFCLKEGKTRVFSSTDPFQEINGQGSFYSECTDAFLMSSKAETDEANYLPEIEILKLIADKSD